jgi:glycosyltransferase involved in cell wall biosynthesis
MKLALITDTYSPQINGVSRTLEQLTKYLVSMGHEVLVVHPEYRSAKRQTQAQSALQPEIVEIKARPLPFYQEVVVALPPYTQMRKALELFQPDIVHIATETMLGNAALNYCRKRGWPVVSSFHTNFDAYTSHYRLNLLKPFVIRYLRWFHNRTEATFVPTNTIINKLKLQGFERLRLWPRGVNTSLFSPGRSGSLTLRNRLGIPDNTFVVGHCGRLASEKNFNFLSQVFCEFLVSSPESHVLIVGDGPARKSLEAKLKSDLYFSSRVHFTGYLTGEDLADAYSAMSAFAFASRTETFGNVLLEAMASGLAVVALAEGGPVDVINNGTTGVLLDPESKPSDMSEILVEWSKSPEQRNRLAAHARVYAETQRWESIMKGLVEEYESELFRNAKS